MAALLIVIALAAPAGADPIVQGQIQARRRVGVRLAEIRAVRHENTTDLTASIARARGLVAVAPGRGLIVDSGRLLALSANLLRMQRDAHVRLHRLDRFVGRIVTRLREERRDIGAWLVTWGVFRVCPVRGWTIVHDDFGEMVRLEGVPPHRHMGNDIEAPTGSPIVAPFDGTAMASWSKLGGQQVRVYGERGYVFNAHLSAYGKLGAVRTGDVIGYVGITGDATGPHDHFEWHPWGGAAQDPHPYLSVVC